MDSQQLKNKIIQRIIEIDDLNTLQSVDNLLNTSDKNITKLVAFINEKIQNDHLSETEDFSGYIKEWVKSM